MRSVDLPVLLCGILLLQGLVGTEGATCRLQNGSIVCNSDFGGGSPSRPPSGRPPFNPPSNPSRPPFNPPSNPSRPPFNPPSNPTRPPFNPSRPPFNPPSNPTRPPFNPTRPPVNPPSNPPMNPRAQPTTINLEGCSARSPPRFQSGRDSDQAFSRALISELMSSCAFLPANFVRIAFHDSATFRSNGRANGANGSIRLEANVPANLVGGQIPRVLRLLSDVQRVLRDVGLNLSYADLVQLAAAEAVRFTGGPNYSIRMGRRDSNSPDDYDSFPAVEPIEILISKFRGMGLSPDDLCALSGAHTIGTVSPSTGRLFDNNYYVAIMRRGGLLASDNALMNNQQTADCVRRFSQNEAEFFSRFAQSMQRVADMGASF